jgi:hypothetical protein
VNTIAKILILAVLVWLGWNRPYRDFVGSYFPSLGVTPSRLAILKSQQPQAAPPADAWTQGNAYAPGVAAAPQPRDRSWMWDRTKLDRDPSKK